MKKPLTIWIEENDIRDDVLKHIKDNMNGFEEKPTLKITMSGAAVEMAGGKINVDMEVKPIDDKIPSTVPRKDIEFILQWGIMNILDLLKGYGYKVDGLEHFDKLTTPKEKSMFNEIEENIQNNLTKVLTELKGTYDD
jgi:hypothetical protein